MTTPPNPLTMGDADERPAVRTVRLAIGAFLLLMVLLPLYRLLDASRTGIAGQYTRALLDIYYEFAWAGLLLLVAIGIVAARVLSPEQVIRVGAVVTRAAIRARTLPFIATCAVMGGLLSAAFALFVLEGKPSYIDAFPQLLQARFWAAGRLAGPSDDLGPFWAIQNALFTDQGWVSQYPPGHVATLVPFLIIGLPWLHGPVMVCLTIAFAGLLAHRIFAATPLVARVGTVLVAVSPFVLFLGASYMNHVTAAACLVGGCYAMIRAWSGRSRWAVASGTIFALALATRPLSALAVASALGVGLIVLEPVPTRKALTTLAWAAVGSLPLIGAWFAYNAYFFGSPLTLGYSKTLGSAAGLGFGIDPWGNHYGPLEAVAYTSADLIGLGVSLLETPISAALVIGVFLITVRIAPAVWLLVLLAMVPVIANGLYWHHSMYMGPRMLYEVAPFWALLLSAAVVSLLRSIPTNTAIAGKYFVRSGVAAMLVCSFAAGVLYLAPRRALSYGGDYLAVTRIPLPQVGSPGLVFVHDAWTARIGMSLAGRGWRLDTVETLLRQNPTCRVHHLARSVVAGDSSRVRAALARLDTVPRADRTLPSFEISPGNRIRTAGNAELTDDCRREAHSDRFGILDIAPLLWRANPHGIDSPGPIVVRDLGPEQNEQMLNAYPERTPYVYMADGDDVMLVSYAEGMQTLWSRSAALPMANEEAEQR